MKTSFAIAMAVVLFFALVAGFSSVQPGELGDFDGDDDSGKPLTVAVFGDWPYSLPLVAAAPLLISSINADQGVRLVLHVGDIHSGRISSRAASARTPGSAIFLRASTAWPAGEIQAHESTL